MKRIRKTQWIVGLVLVLSLIIVGPALAVHDLGLFELDRNATDQAGGGDDWATLYGGGGSAAEFTGIIEDTTGTNPLGTLGTQFQAGGSKDDLDISPGGATGQVWKWDPGEPLDKDDITNAYAAAYVNTLDTGNNNIGDLIIYFGLDRFANNGSAQVGFWFLQDPTFGLTTTPSGGGYLFSGHHVVGDVLVQSNFTQGGVIDNISVYEWVGSGGSNGTLNLLFNAQDCATTGADDPACATVNQGDTPSPWPFTPKFGTSGTFPRGSFFEGGINITRLVPDAGCFTGFLAETRSSTPFDSRLKDFAFGNFQLCSIAVTKTGDTLSKVGDDVDYTITIENTGALTLYKQSIEDTLLGNLTGDAGCGASLAPGGTCTISISRTVQAGDPDPLPNTVTAIYNNKSDFSGTAVSDSDDHSVNLFQPSITVDKTGDTLSKVGDDVTYTIKVCNTSSADTPILVKDSVTDNLIAGVDGAFGASLASGACESHNFTRTVVAGDPDPLVNTATAHYHPTGFPNDITASDGHSVNLFQPAIAVDKTGDTLSKVGDDVDYTFTLSNNSSTDTPALDCTAEDTLLGTIFDGVLPLGDTVINKTRTVQAGDPDPLDNTVTLTCSPEGFPNVLEASDSHSVNLFQPAIAIDKTGDELSKVGDDVDYTITLSNNSSADTPALNCKATDSLLGEVFNGVLPLGDTVINKTRTVQAGDPDPLVNSVSMTCGIAGFPNVLNAGPATHSTNLFQPAVEVIKTGPDTAVRGETITYSFTINNLSSPDSPDLILESVTDTVLGDLTAAAASAGCGTLGFSGNCSFTFDYTIQSTDPSPLVNVVTVLYHPDGFPNDITDDDDHTVLIPILGCTPGFWQGGAGIQLWDEPPIDPQWPNDATQPYYTQTLFNAYFNVVTDPRLDGLTMLDLVGSGGTSDSARRAARDMVAAYLNESAFPADFPATSLADLEAMWYAAVAGGDSALDAFHVLVSGWNNPAPPGFCPLP
jgi:uncharacterized repeat protein (TIGR01451 family)